MKLSVLICAYSPNLERLLKVIESLKVQTLSKNFWELIIIDNGSPNSIKSAIDLSWHNDAKIIREETLGLIYARIRGAHEAKYDIHVSVDDDTPLFCDYLQHVLQIMKAHPTVGIIGGRSIPIFEVSPPDWIKEFHGCLALRDLGEQIIIEKIEKGDKIKTYPQNAPLLICLRSKVMHEYIEHFNSNQISRQLGRRGDSLASGEDNDINLFAFKNGFGLGYFPQLKFYHIIPASRLNKMYLARLQRSMNSSWIKVLEMYDINPWKGISKRTLKLRIIKAYIKHKAWRGDANYIRWQGSCGFFEGLSELK